MDYCQAVDNTVQMGSNHISAATATEKQLANLGLDAKVGITPMIGVNDIASEVFTLADAKTLVDYAKNNPDVDMLSMWSVSRDNSHAAGPTGSGITQDPFEFSGIFHQFDHII